MKSVTFTGTRTEVQSKATEWKTANRNVRVVADCRPAVIISHGPEQAPDARIWAGSIYYEDAPSN